MSDEVKGLMGIVVDETTIASYVEINSLHIGVTKFKIFVKSVYLKNGHLVLNGELPRSKELQRLLMKKEIISYLNKF